MVLNPQTPRQEIITYTFIETVTSVSGHTCTRPSRTYTPLHNNLTFAIPPSVIIRVNRYVSVAIATHAEVIALHVATLGERVAVVERQVPLLVTFVQVWKKTIGIQIITPS